MKKLIAGMLLLGMFIVGCGDEPRKPAGGSAAKPADTAKPK